MKRYWKIALLGICVTLTGCGTINRFTESRTMKEEMLYPATTNDGDAIRWCITPTYNENYVAGIFTPFIFVGRLADMPLSIAVDTVMFPYDWYRYKHYEDYVQVHK